MTMLNAQRAAILKSTIERLELAVDRAVSVADWTKIRNNLRSAH
jgi:hypothetical protein